MEVIVGGVYRYSKQYVYQVEEINYQKDYVILKDMDNKKYLSYPYHTMECNVNAFWTLVTHPQTLENEELFI